MKRTMLALALMLAPAVARADPVEGLWKTEPDAGKYAYVTVSACGDRFCGVISRTFDDSGEYRSDNLGHKIVWDMQAKGDGTYGGGQIWQPSTGKVYSSKMTLSGDKLRVAGCIGPICKKQNWTRVK